MDLVNLVKSTQCLPRSLHHEKLRHRTFIPLPKPLNVLLKNGEEELHFRRHLGEPRGGMRRLDDERDEGRPHQDVGNGHASPVRDGTIVVDGFEDYPRTSPHCPVLRKFRNGGEDAGPGRHSPCSLR